MDLDKRVMDIKRAPSHQQPCIQQLETPHLLLEFKRLVHHFGQAVA
jgi:hypothetical protein